MTDLTKKRSKLWIITALLAVLLLLGCLSLPYGYYQFLRIVVCLGSIIAIVDRLDKGIDAFNVVMGLIVILFNPILPIHLSKDIWVVIDIAVAIWFLFFTIVNFKDNAQIDRHE